MSQFYTLDDLIVLHINGKLRTNGLGGVTDFEQKNRETQQKSSQYRDVHVYDGQQEPINSVCYPPELKAELLRKFLLILENPVAVHMARKIMSEHVYDSANHLQTDDLLADILIRRMSVDIFLLLEEQLADNFMLGQCPMGRSHRLMQIRRMLD